MNERDPSGRAGSSAPTARAAGGILTELEALLRDRVEVAPAGSYSAGLVRDPEHVARKVVEEAYELAVELQRPALQHERVASEAADLLFHVLAALAGAHVPLENVLEELGRRRASSR